MNTAAANVLPVMFIESWIFPTTHPTFLKNQSNSLILLILFIPLNSYLPSPREKLKSALALHLSVALTSLPFLQFRSNTDEWKSPSSTKALALWNVATTGWWTMCMCSAETQSRTNILGIRGSLSGGSWANTAQHSPLLWPDGIINGVWLSNSFRDILQLYSFPWNKNFDFYFSVFPSVSGNKH